MADEADLQGLNPGAARLAEAALQKQREAGHAQLGAFHWLLALVERHGAMAEALAEGLSAASLGPHLGDQLRQGNVGAPLGQDQAVARALELAHARGRSDAAERDLAAAILEAAGYRLIAPAGASPRSATSPGATEPATSSVPAGHDVSVRVVAGPLETPAAAGQGAYKPRATRPTPMLEQFGRDLTRATQEGKLGPLIGRELELELVVETLCRTTKRNPVLVGPAGVGKTAIVEGLAQRVVRGEVPRELRDARIVELKPSVLVAGAGVVGELQERMKQILAEAQQDGIVLFVDEVHSIVGAGGQSGTSDLASMLKPPLSRGDFACIAATTDDEYRRYIQPDEALERRFQPIRVQELTPEQTLAVLRGLRDQLRARRGVEVPDEVLAWLIDFAGQFLRNRYFPDKAVDLLDQCVAHAVSREKQTVDLADAETVARRLVGMPADVRARLQTLRERLPERAPLPEADLEALLNRLAVTARGLDVSPARPNAVVLLVGEAASYGDELAAVLAESLAGSADRVISIDFSRLVDDSAITLLIGAPPGYVGYSESLPLHRLEQMPWSVVLCHNLHACHPTVRELVAQVLADGFVTDGRGERLYLSDAVVVLTADVGLATRRQFGFKRPDAADEPAGRESSDEARRAAEKVLGAELVALCDLVSADVLASDATRRRWIEQHLLGGLARRYRKQGLELRWEPSLVNWLLEQQRTRANQHEWERLVDERLAPALLPHLEDRARPDARAFTLRYDAGEVRADAE